MTTTIAAVLQKSTSQLEVKEVPVAPISSDEILVESRAASINGTDYYHIDYDWAPDGAIMGLTVSGVVLKVGKDVTRFIPGDYIASFIHGGDYSNPEKGAYSKLAVVQEVYSIKLNKLSSSNSQVLPPGNIDTFEGACSLSNTIVTLGCSLYFTLGGSFSQSQNKSLLIYGGSTATGLVASQIAKQFGWTVISVASKKHATLIKGFGADHLIDYHDSNVTQQIKNIDPNITMALHTVGGTATLQLTHDSVSDVLPTKIDSLVVSSFEAIKNPKSNVKFTMTRAFTANGNDVIYNNGSSFPAIPGVKEAILEFIPSIQNLINGNKIKHIPIRIQPNGLNGINDGLKLIRGGQISGEKLVIQF
ncbi:DEHA2A14608p [Debaryomyces hansenii CBS767]|uniref:DEHA2A14608p n=1 Tax=Debaryomyces hansenii (strain ATCC 36239 / CBS 767 / BCRC 21394 / JCM 1990 / NBRC 0083 / IGC 2968) TaxID=284592 RepID=Q6BXV8_DEBHA|nr:DEHA2A14608p [Debaryomyces hansenii CBS767]CAG84940.2 DEHA2A14608p [Debaryomyces hansenii CBS767]|eukprot:XP_456961.2 DEHA2A14608p [Debaryomyces hansenii CBS767]